MQHLKNDTAQCLRYFVKWKKQNKYNLTYVEKVKTHICKEKSLKEKLPTFFTSEKQVAGSEGHDDEFIFEKHVHLGILILQWACCIILFV